MSVVDQQFRNIMNEPIWLKIEQFGAGNSQCRVTIRRNCYIYQRFVLIVLFVTSALSAYLWSNATFFLISAILTFLFPTLVLVYLQPVTEEILEIYDNFEGIQISKRYFLSKRSSLPTFLNTNKIIVNEVITMQRVIFCMLAVPKNLHHLILQSKEMSGEVTIDKKNTKLIPLFIHTLPRLDCVQTIYSHIYHFRTCALPENGNICS